MKIKWLVSAKDVARVTAVVESQSDNPLFLLRQKENLADTKPPVTKARFWRAMVCMRLTTQQRSGPDSAVTTFTVKRPFPLTYSAVRRSRPKEEALIAKSLRAAGGIRFCDKIGKELAHNLALLEGGEWSEALKQCNQLTRLVPQDIEAAVAGYIDEHFVGFGPKQARNLLQALSLTRYEIPIDSRVTKWLNNNGFPVRLSAEALQDRNYYTFVSDGVQALCEKSGVVPCLFDAAIFALGDSGQWTAAKLTY